MSYDRIAAERAAFLFAKHHVGGLGVQLASMIGSMPIGLFMKDKSVAKLLRRPSDGREYHRGSICRRRGELAKIGMFRKTRYGPNAKLPDGWRSNQGRAHTEINWAFFGERDPWRKSEKRGARQVHQARVDELVERSPRRPAPSGPAESGKPAHVGPVLPIFAELVRGIGLGAPPSPRVVHDRPAAPVASAPSQTAERRRWTKEEIDRELERRDRERGPP